MFSAIGGRVDPRWGEGWAPHHQVRVCLWRPWFYTAQGGPGVQCRVGRRWGEAQRPQASGRPRPPPCWPAFSPWPWFASVDSATPNTERETRNKHFRTQSAKHKTQHVATKVVYVCCGGQLSNGRDDLSNGNAAKQVHERLWVERSGSLVRKRASPPQDGRVEALLLASGLGLGALTTFHGRTVGMAVVRLGKKLDVLTPRDAEERWWWTFYGQSDAVSFLEVLDAAVFAEAARTDELCPSSRASRRPDPTSCARLFRPGCQVRSSWWRSSTSSGGVAHAARAARGPHVPPRP